MSNIFAEGYDSIIKMLFLYDSTMVARGNDWTKKLAKCEPEAPMKLQVDKLRNY